jgi:hypothetical protein
MVLDYFPHSGTDHLYINTSKQFTVLLRSQPKGESISAVFGLTPTASLDVSLVEI